MVGEDQVGNVLEHLSGLTLRVSAEIKVDTFQLLKSVFVEQVGDVEAAAGKHLNRQGLQLDVLVGHLSDSLELDVRVPREQAQTFQIWASLSDDRVDLILAAVSDDPNV